MERFIIEIPGIKAVAERKNVKYIRISIKPPDGQVHVSMPKRASIAAVKAFMEQKREWITDKQLQYRRRMQAVQGAGAAETVLLWGQNVPLLVVTGTSAERAYIEDGRVIIHLRQGSANDRLTELLDGVMRSELQRILPELAEKWEGIMGVSADQWRTKRMKTRWGSCNTAQKRIWLNVRLAMLPQECLEYVIAHELCHLYEPSHNARFKALMDQYHPGWREVKKRMSSMSGVLYLQAE